MTAICNHPSPEDIDRPTPTEQLLSRKDVIANLSKLDTQEALADFLIEYWSEFYDVYLCAVTQQAGRRPDQITNEMFSALHHLARGLVIPNANTKDEITKARASHIKRATLDSFKIAINSTLEYEIALEENLDHIIGNSELKKYHDYNDILEKIKNIKTLKRQTHDEYRRAKSKEARGEFQEANQHYKNALEYGMRLNQILRSFRDDIRITDALVTEGKLQRAREEDILEERKHRKITYIITVFGIILAFTGTMCLVFKDALLLLLGMKS